MTKIFKNVSIVISTAFVLGGLLLPSATPVLASTNENAFTSTQGTSILETEGLFFNYIPNQSFVGEATGTHTGNTRITSSSTTRNVFIRDAGPVVQGPGSSTVNVGGQSVSFSYAGISITSSMPSGSATVNVPSGVRGCAAFYADVSINHYTWDIISNSTNQVVGHGSGDGGSLSNGHYALHAF
jgi:hypothetical protein